MSFRVSMNNHFFPLVILCMMSLFVFANTMDNSFMWDDEELILENRHVKNIANIPAVFIPKNEEHYRPVAQSRYRPVRTVTFALDFLLWKSDPKGYHVTNLILHILNVVLVYFFILQLLESQNRKRLLSVSFLAAAFFAVHPIHTESVSWIKNRSDILSLTFFLPSVMIFIRYALNKENRFLALPYCLSLLFFALALLSKEMALSLPLILGLYVVCFLPKEECTTGIVKTGPFVVLAAFYLLFQLKNFKAIQIYEHSEQVHFYPHILSVIKTIGTYLTLLIAPINLNAERIFYLPDTFLELSILFYAAILIILCIVINKTFRNSRPMTFAVAWILLTLIPVMNIIFLSGRPIAEQRLYIPSLGFCLVLAIVVTKIKSKSIMIVSFVGILLFYSTITIKRNLDWNNSITFWTKTVEQSPQSARAHSNLGKAYFHEGQGDKAIIHYKKAIAIDPRNARAHNNIGNAFAQSGKMDIAIDAYKKAIALEPKYPHAFYNLGKAYYAQGVYNQALTQFQKAINIYPNFIEAHNNLGITYADTGDLAKALVHYKQAIKLDPHFSQAYNNLANGLADQGKFNDAIQAYKLAIEIDPHFAQAYNNLGETYLESGNHQEAIASFKKAIENKPDFSEAQQNLNAVLINQIK